MPLALLVLGGLICAANFYLSFLRWPLHRLRGVPADRIRHVSGIPLFGSLLVVVGLLLGPKTTGRVTAAAVLLLLDTAGPLWFLSSILFDAVARRRSGHD